MRQKKKVILFVIDSLVLNPLESCLEQGLLPAFSFICRHGEFYRECISTFPTMTPVAAASIATGRGPDLHRVPGFIWYDDKTARIVNYGATPAAVRRIGVREVVDNLLFRLNGTHLNPDILTVYEILEEQGYSSGCVNFFIFRGKKHYLVNLPLALRLATGNRLKGRVSGPQFLALGDMVMPPGLNLHPFNGIRQKFGVNDCYSGEAVAGLIAKGCQPDFLLVYFPDTDGFAHRQGAMNIQPCLMNIDWQLQKILDAFGGWDRALENTVFMIAGDHAQSNIGYSREHLINLDKLLRGYRRLAINETFSGQADVALAPNERMAIIYLLQRPDQLLPGIVEIMAGDPRIALVMWQEDTFCRVRRGRLQLDFCPGSMVFDEYGMGWDYRGNLEVVTGYVSGNRVKFRDYPDAFGRIKAALDCQSLPRVLLSAEPGFEFDGEAAPIHPGRGSHGSLHRVDSAVPLLAAGTDYRFNHPRITDLMTFVLQHFNIPVK